MNNTSVTTTKPVVTPVSYAYMTTTEKAISWLCHGGFIQAPYSSKSRTRDNERIYNTQGEHVGNISDLTHLKVLDIMGFVDEGGVLQTVSVGNLTYHTITGKIPFSVIG
jgi:hypothetical protein